MKRLSELAAKWRADGSYNCHACSSDMHARALCADELEATLAASSAEFNHDTRDCILCHKRIDPNGGICFGCCEKRFASITHADWELLAVCDLAPYADERYENPRAAVHRGEEVLATLHKALFGTWPDAECRECK